MIVKLHAIAALVFLSGLMPARAAEVDQFTRRFDPPADSSAEINRWLNELMQIAVDKANEFEQGWRANSTQKGREWRLYKELRKHFHNHTKSEFMKELIDKDKEDDGIDRQRLPRSESIFSGWSLFDGIILGGRNADDNPLAFSPLIRMGEVSIGVDKLEHLFDRGWQCFEGKYQRGLSDARVLYLTSLSEKLIYGGNRLATGVFSYADLVANFNGMRFWNDVLQKQDDILGAAENAGPYIVRRDGVWQVNADKPIDMNHYIDWGMDEAINCSRYARRSAASKVRQALLALGERDPDHTYLPPMDPEKFAEISRKYGKYSKDILNYRGIGKRGLFFFR